MVKRMVVLAMALVALMATPAMAQQYPPNENLITVSDTTPCPGQSVTITAQTFTELETALKSLDGQLTATIHATADDLAKACDLLPILERKVGRVIMNGFPTGVEVCAAMNHGGPYPATTDARFTSVGTAAIQRWARPICYQNFPPDTLPEELRNENPRGIMRTLNDDLTRAAV